MVKFTLNGEAQELNVPSANPLLWVLRESLELTGTKFGCGIGQCGACMVLVDGQPIRSCQLPVSAADGTEVTTIEGLSEQGPHPVQEAWVEEQVPQCGYCQSGQIISAVALLEVNPQGLPKNSPLGPGLPFLPWSVQGSPVPSAQTHRDTLRRARPFLIFPLQAD